MFRLLAKTDLLSNPPIMSKIKTEYRKRLPHIHPVGATFFITFRLEGSIPVASLDKLRKKYDDKYETILFDDQPLKTERIALLYQKYFDEFDELLHAVKSGPTWLESPAIAKLVEEQLMKYDGEFYDLLCYCIMSNHVHIVFDTSIQVPIFYDSDLDDDFGYVQVDQIMKQIKGPVAVYANRLLGRTGAFWVKESYDRYIRNARDLKNTILYTVNNAVKAGLVDDWRDWPFVYWKNAE